jgi:hypothetical protein
MYKWLEKGFRVRLLAVLCLLVLAQARSAPAESTSGLVGQEMQAKQVAVIVNDEEANSVAVATYYQQARQIPEENVVHVRIPHSPHRLKVEEFNALREQIESRIGPEIQAIVLVWTAPYAVECNSITAALTLGFDAKQCTGKLPRLQFQIKTLHENAIAGERDIMIYQTGLVSVPKLDTLGFLPGALADHLTSSGGDLLGTSQMSSLRWLDAGATASYGTVSEPCNYWQKFPHPQVLLRHYLAGETAIEAYWKSVAWPMQGVVIGEPLAAPYRRRNTGGP